LTQQKRRAAMMMKRKDIVEFTGLCYTTIYNLEKQGKFPARRQLSPGRVAWVRSEVTAWVDSRLTPAPKEYIKTFICISCSDPCAFDAPHSIIPASCVLYAE